MLLGVSLLTVGTAAAVCAFWCCARKVLPRLRLWLALLGGLTAGLGLLSGVASWAVGLFGDISGHAGVYGVVTLVLGVLLILEVGHALNPKTKYKGHRWVHPVLTFAMPALLLAFGGLFGEAVGWLHNGAEQMPNMASFLVRR